MPLNVNYEAVLADLEQRRAELEAGIAAIRRIVGRFGPNLPVQSNETNITAAVLRFLSERRFESFYTYQIADAIGAKTGNVRGAIFRYTRKGALAKDEDGRVCFVGAATEENRNV